MKSIRLPSYRITWQTNRYDWDGQYLLTQIVDQARDKACYAIINPLKENDVMILLPLPLAKDRYGKEVFLIKALPDQIVPLFQRACEIIIAHRAAHFKAMATMHLEGRTELTNEVIKEANDTLLIMEKREEKPLWQIMAATFGLHCF